MLDRTKQPELNTIDSIKMVAPEKILTDSGKIFYVHKTQTSALLRIDFLYKAGKRFAQNQAIPVLANALLNKGTGRYTAQEIAERLDFYGVYMEHYSGADYAGVSFYMLDSFFGKIFPLITEILQEPVYPENEVKLAVEKAKQNLKINKEKVKYVAGKLFMHALFNKHPYGVSIDEADYNVVSSVDLRHFHKAFYGNAEVLIVLSGGVSDKTIEQMKQWYDTSKYRDFTNLQPNMPEIDIKRTHFCRQKDGALQTALKIGTITIEKSHRDYAGLVFVNTILGGYFGSRLIRNIREEKGYTYGIYSSVLPLVDASVWVISSEVNAEYTQAAIDEVFKEIKRLQTEPIGDSELELVRNYMVGSLLQQFDGAFSAAEIFINLQKFNMDYRYYSRLLQTVNRITKEDIMHIANVYFNVEKLITVSVGVCGD